MGSKSNAFENLILDHTLGGVSFGAPGTVWVGLWTSALSDASTGSSGGEVSGGAYARLAKATGTANFTAASGGTVKNASVFTFAAATANWGTVTDVAVLNAATAGTILYWAALTVAKAVNNGDTASFAVNDLVITED